MSAIDKAKAHYKEVLSAGLQGPIRVPEWDAEIYYKPSANFSQQAQVIELHQAGKSVEALVMTLILRALDSEGKALFSKANKAELMKSVDPDVIVRIVDEINDHEVDVDEALGN